MNVEYELGSNQKTIRHFNYRTIFSREIDGALYIGVIDANIQDVEFMRIIRCLHDGSIPYELIRALPDPFRYILKHKSGKIYMHGVSVAHWSIAPPNKNITNYDYININMNKESYK
jgi:hypothetical protein